MRGLEKTFHENGNKKEAEVAVLIQTKQTLKQTVIRDKKEHYIMIKGSIVEDITIVSMRAPKIEAPKYISQLLVVIKEDDSNIIIVGDFNAQIMSKDRSS